MFVNVVGDLFLIKVLIFSGVGGNLIKLRYVCWIRMCFLVVVLGDSFFVFSWDNIKWLILFVI